jgi:Holliday junction DNA helicase RuvA
MIDYIKGILTLKKPTKVILESGGIGFEVHITVPAFEILPDIGSEARLITHFHVKENPFSFVLFGFSDEEERECFRQIISVSGIGPKTAMTILSAIKYTDFVDMISRSDFLPLTQVSGVGRKTAERLAVELKDKIGKSTDTPSVQIGSGKFESLNKASEVIQALMTLGYNRLEADKMMKSVTSRDGFTKMSVEEIIKEVLSGK